MSWRHYLVFLPVLALATVLLCSSVFAELLGDINKAIIAVAETMANWANRRSGKQDHA